LRLVGGCGKQEHGAGSGFVHERAGLRLDRFRRESGLWSFVIPDCNVLSGSRGEPPPAADWLHICKEAAMGEIVSPAIARLKELGDRAYRGRIREPKDRQARIWSREPDVEIVKGSLRDIGGLVPEFERRPASGATGRVEPVHSHLDMLVRRAGSDGDLVETPVGLVTRRHHLSPHARVIQAIDRGLGAIQADPAEAPCELELSHFGGQMTMWIDLPVSFELNLGSGERLGLRLLCRNPIASGGPHLLLSWNRQTSGSLMPVGTTRLEFGLGQRPALCIAEVAPAVCRALRWAQIERTELALWREIPVTRDQLVRWTDAAIRRVWGPRTAARIFHVAVSGWDAEPAYGFERMPPSRRTMCATRSVPAGPPFSETAYDALLAAAWVANQEIQLQRRIERLAEIGVLMRALLRPGHKR